MTNELNSDSIKLMETIQASFDHLFWENPMGETRKDALRLDCDMVDRVTCRSTDYGIKWQILGNGRVL